MSAPRRDWLSHLLIPEGSGRLMAVLHGFFDDTKSRGPDIMFGLAGFLFDSDGLARFQRDWAKRAPGLSPKFRTSTFRSRDGEVYRAASQHDREFLLRDLARLIARYRGAGFVCSVDVAAVNQWLAKSNSKARSLLGPYSICAIEILRMIREYLTGIGCDEEVAITLEAGTNGEADAAVILNRIVAREEIHKTYGIAGFAPVRKGAHAALIAADYLACEWQANYCEVAKLEREGKDAGQWREEFKLLFEADSQPILHKHLSSDRQFDMLEMMFSIQGLHMPFSRRPDAE
jgi:hypothetical protein